MALALLLGALGLGLLGLGIWRHLDRRADRAEMDRLIALQPAEPVVFSTDMVADLPEPARRFLCFAIREGTPLHTVARIEMEGRFAMGNKAAPGYMRMRATEVLAAPDGFIWAMSGGRFGMQVSGSDSARWTRFWLFGLLPVARFGGDPDHGRSAFGRYVAEALFWTPAAVLPGPNVTWDAVSQTVARMTMRRGALEQSVDITVDASGQPQHVSFLRWSNANPEKKHRLQPFGGHLSAFRDFGGFTLPTHIEAGNMFGTEDYFPFFIANVTEVRFPEPNR